nr:ribonuclease H-like domain-containing protein [Tanacetum cinerariifolium]
MFDCDGYLSSESDEGWPPSSIYDRFQPSDRYHAVLPPYTGTFMPPIPDLVFNTAPTVVETDHSTFNVQLSPTKPDQDFPTKPKQALSHTNRPIAHIIEDWVSDSEDESKTKPPHIVPSFVQSSEQVKNPRHSVQHVETSIPTVTSKTASPKPASSGKTRNRKACFVCKSVEHLIKDCDYHAKKMAQLTPRNHAHMGNMSYLYDFKELNGGYVAFGGNPKGGKITSKGKIKNRKLDFDDVYFVKELKFNLFNVSQMCDKKNSVLFTDTECLVLSSDFKLPDASQVLLRVPRENNMYNVNLKNIIPSRDLTCLFEKATLDESNLRHRRLGHVNFKTINKLGNPEHALKDKGVIDSGCSRNMTRNMSYLCDFEELNGGYVAFRGNPKGDSLLPITFWAEAVKTAYYVQNKVLVTKPHNKTLYELLHGRTPSIGFIRPFGCPVTILNTLDSLGKFDGNADEGFLVGYSVTSKAFRVFNSRTRIVQETLHVNFLENKPNVAGEESDQQYVLFPVWSSGFINPQNTDGDAAFYEKEHEFDEKKPEFDEKKLESEVNVSPSSSAQSKKQDNKTKREDKGKSPVESFTGYRDLSVEFEDYSKDSINEVNAADITDSEDEDDVGAKADFNNLETSITNTDGDAAFDEKEHEFDEKKPEFNEKKLESEVNVSLSSSAQSKKQDNKTKREDKGKSPVESFTGYRDLSAEFEDYSKDSINEVNAADITDSEDEDDVGAKADFNNLETSITVSPIPTTRVHKDHLMTQIIGDLSLATQTRSMRRVAKDQSGLS